ncbi:growth arrest-specific protein 8-like [Stegastes partitus]|uniref:Dynein regulatory complex subunit 4 n=1 Tax=Stegastes partitus TaxID=144197 RepID=A0A9Y4K4L8_9TELE|nr:PREDICTED: growth arrest-specific protein 8-like [Stegastes partitus]
MPRKTQSKKAGKGMSSSVVATEEMAKDQLMEDIIRLREELDRVREEKSSLRRDQDKIQVRCEISKRELEEKEAKLRNRRRQKEEAKERHRVEIGVYEQKMKHVLLEHHNRTTEQKVEGVASSTLVQNRHWEAELELHKDFQGQQAELRKNKLHGEIFIKDLKLKHQVELMELNNECKHRIREMEVQFEQQMHSLIKAEEERRLVEVDKVDDQMKSRVAALLEKQDRAVQSMEMGHESNQEEAQKEMKRKKEKMAKVQKRHEQLSEAQQENQRLKEVLQEVEHKNHELKKQIQEHDEAVARWKVSRPQVKLMEKELRDLKVEHVLLQQACEEVERERDELQTQQTHAVLDLQQRSGLRQMRLQRKLEEMTQTHQKKEAQLCAALSFCSTDPQARASATSRLEEYDKLLLTCTDRLKALGVPLHDFPFRPAKQILSRMTLNP